MLRKLVIFLAIWHAAVSAVPTNLRSNVAPAASAIQSPPAGLVELEETKKSEIVPVAVGAFLAETALGGLILNIAASLIYDVAKWIIGGGTEGSCTRGSLSSPITTFNNVDNDLKQYCDTKDLTWDPTSTASVEKKWHLHAHKSLTFWKECLYEAKWGPQVGGKWYDCREATVQKNVQKNKAAQTTQYMTTLKAKYPPNKFTWGYHVEGVSIHIKSCTAEYHNGYIRPLIAAPAGLVSGKAKEQEWVKNPYFFLLTELWTGGDCTGETKSPGVRYYFSYKVDMAKGVIIYDQKKVNGRPSFSEPHYVLQISEATGKPTPFQLQAYTEKTTGICEELHAKGCGSWGRGII